MLHLTPERIAALADEPATLVERSHLAECAACNADLSAAQRLVRMALTDTPAIERPLTSWERLSPALRAEGLIERPIGPGELGADVISLPARRASRARVLMQAAAGLFLAVGGAVVGRASATLPVTGLADATVSADTIFNSTSDAMRVLNRASGDQQRAIAYLAANDSNVTLSGRDAAELYRTRLEVLDPAVASAAAALYRSPRDPVLNQVYRSNLGARDLTLRQLGGAVPVSNTNRTRF